LLSSVSTAVEHEMATTHLRKSTEFHFPRRHVMLQWALTFLVLALIAALLGFGGLAGTMAWIGQVLFVVFLVLFIVSLVTGGIRRPIP
jgi:uncharacterized membrane protein YtjA (UPF0391 family)